MTNTDSIEVSVKICKTSLPTAAKTKDNFSDSDPDEDEDTDSDSSDDELCEMLALQFTIFYVI